MARAAKCTAGLLMACIYVPAELMRLAGRKRSMCVAKVLLHLILHMVMLLMAVNHHGNLCFANAESFDSFAFWLSDKCSGDDKNRPMPQLKAMFVNSMKCHFLHRNSATEASSRNDGSGGHHFLAQGHRYLVERADH
jgi:hypothetical protein